MIGQFRLQDDQYNKAIIHLQSQLNASKAEVARLHAALTKDGVCIPSVHRHALSGALQTDLIAKVSELHNELLISQTKWSEEKRAIASSHAAAQQSVAASHRLELADHRSKLAEMEDELALQRERFRDLEKEKIVFMQKMNISVANGKSLAKECENQRSDVEVLKQSLALANYSNEAKHELIGSQAGAEQDVEQSETRFRTMENKV